MKNDMEYVQFRNLNGFTDITIGGDDWAEGDLDRVGFIFMKVDIIR